jgi:hypothetical protein
LAIESESDAVVAETALPNGAPASAAAAAAHMPVATNKATTAFHLPDSRRMGIVAALSIGR